MEDSPAGIKKNIVCHDSESHSVIIHKWDIQ